MDSFISGCFYFGKPMPMDETKAFTKAKGMEWEEFSV